MNGYVAAGYGTTLVSLAGYAAYVLRRARSLRARTAPAPTPTTDGARR